MKIIFTFLFFWLANTAFGQSAFPDFLQGVWKMKDKAVYEHWNKLNEYTLKGVAYTLKNGSVAITEYLHIAQDKEGVIYTATVVSQNKGEGIEFRLTRADSLYVFENPVHDFPKKIIYQPKGDSAMLVKLSDGGQKTWGYTMHKQVAVATNKDTTVSNPHYDAGLAGKFGADAYGMKKYILVILKTGDNQTKDKAVINRCFKGHLENITRLVEEGKMIVAGPLGKNSRQYRGIFILQVTELEEAEKLLQSDPAIQEDLLDAELYHWYGSAALPEYLEAADKVWKVKP